MKKICGPIAGLIVAAATLLPAAEPAGKADARQVAPSVSAIQPVSLNLAAGLSTAEKIDEDSDPKASQKKTDSKKKADSDRKAETPSEKAGASSKASGKTADKKPAKRKPLKRKVVIVKAAWCGACQALNYEWPKLRKVRWRIGGANTDHFQLIDVDANPDVVGRYGITQLPTLLLIEDGKVLQRAGGLNAKDLAEFYYGRL